MDILLVGTYTQHDAPAVLEKQELGKGIYLIPYNEILGDVAGTPLIIQGRKAYSREKGRSSDAWKSILSY